MEKQSFSYHVKEEIISKINSKAKADACMLGILTFCNVLSEREIVFLTEHKSVAEFFAYNCGRICGEETAVRMSETGKRNEAILYRLEVDSSENRMKLLDHFRMDGSRRLSQNELPKPKLYPQLAAGIFLACGSVNNPEKKYHMEFVMPDIRLCNDFGLLLLENYGILAKQTERKNYQIVYVKESENIIDMLTLMGATNCSLELMNVKIMKDMRNKINRAMNCDNANIEKAIKAAEKQIADIELIDDTVGIGSLPDNLQEIARLRYDNPDYTLGDLGKALDPPISRSGANHRLQKLAQIADEIRAKQK